MWGEALITIALGVGSAATWFLIRLFVIRIRNSRLEQSVKDALPKKTISTKRVLIIQTGNAPYVNEVSSLITSETRRLFNQKKSDIIFSTYTLDESIEGATSDDGLLKSIESNHPDLLVTIGSTATIVTRETQAKTRNKSIPQIFTAITKKQAKAYFGDLSSDPLKPNIGGVTFSITQSDRLDFINKCLNPKKIGFITNGKIDTDLHAYLELLEHIEKKRIEVELELVVDDISSQPTRSFAEFDAILGWYYLHAHMKEYVRTSDTIVIGGGALDARSGAAISLADDERNLAEAVIESLIIPFFFQNSQPHDTDILDISEVLSNYSRKIYISRSGIDKIKSSLPSDITRKAQFYE